MQEAGEKKKWSYQPAETAQTLRLSEFWHGSQRIVVGNFYLLQLPLNAKRKASFIVVL